MNRLAAIAVAAVAATTAGCGTATPPPRRDPIANTAGPDATAIQDADDAIDRFIDAWTADVRPTIPGHRDPLIAQIDASMREPDARKRYSAKPMACTDAARDIEGMVAKPDDMVLFGSLAGAKAHTQCWQVLYSCCMKGDAGAAVDATTGELLVAWRIPEG